MEISIQGNIINTIDFLLRYCNTNCAHIEFKIIQTKKESINKNNPK